MKIEVLNGPNLNTLGRREPARYGTTTLPELEQHLIAIGAREGVEVSAFQSNNEGALIDRIHHATDAGVDAFIINAGAYTHTSIALRDALLGTEACFVEVHITNVHAREPFRHHSYLSDIADGVIVGFGTRGYELALMGLIARFKDEG